MHGLINRAVERFARDTYGRDLWKGVMHRLDLGFTEFEAMLTYDDRVTDRLLDALAEALEKGREEVLEDIGTYLVSHETAGALRRLLRFSGVDFVDFLHSLDDLPARARLAVPDLDVPLLELHEHTAQRFSLTVRARAPGPVRFGHLAVGLLRAMADEYGALVVLDYKGGGSGSGSGESGGGGDEIVEIMLLQEAHAAGRDFSLGETAQ